MKPEALPRSGLRDAERLDWLRLIRSENALLSMAVIVLLVLMHAREGGTRPSLLTLSPGLLVGGALGNLVDRLANGFVFDFIDIGIGSTRFWTFNVADMAITSGIALLVAQAAFAGVRNRVRAPHG